MFGVIHVSDSYAIVLLLENPNTILLLIETTCYYQIAAALSVKLETPFKSATITFIALPVLPHWPENNVIHH